jgi:hypothetical protein
MILGEKLMFSFHDIEGKQVRETAILIIQIVYKSNKELSFPILINILGNLVSILLHKPLKISGRSFSNKTPTQKIKKGEKITKLFPGV